MKLQVWVDGSRLLQGEDSSPSDSKADQGGNSTIPNTNVDVETPPPEAASVFEDAQGSTAKIINPSGTAVSLEIEDGSHETK